MPDRDLTNVQFPMHNSQIPIGHLTNVQFPMHNSQPKWTFSQKTRNSAEWLRLRSEPLGLVGSPSVRIRIEHWELNIGQILDLIQDYGGTRKVRTLKVRLCYFFSSSSMIFLKTGYGCAPTTTRPLMKNTGVPWMPTSSPSALSLA